MSEKYANQYLVRVFKIPTRNGNFIFGAERTACFTEVDWFQDVDGFMGSESGREKIAEFVLKKEYAKNDTPLLIMSPTASFTINYHAE